MDNPAAVHVAKHAAQLDNEIDHGRPSGAGGRVQDVAALDEVHCEAIVRRPDDRLEVVALGEMRMAKASQRAKFDLEEVDQRRSAAHHLERERPRSHGVQDSVDSAHAAFAGELLDTISAIDQRAGAKTVGKPGALERCDVVTAGDQDLDIGRSRR